MTREYKSRDVTQSRIYVIVIFTRSHFAHNHFRPQVEGCGRYGFFLHWQITCELKGMEGMEGKEYGPTPKGRDTEREMGRERTEGEREKREGSSLP